MNKYMGSINTISGVLVKSKNKVLLCKRAPKNTLPNMWSIPCGHLEKNEPPLVGAKREFYEETNIKLDKINLIGFMNKVKKGENVKNKLIYVFFHENDEEILPDLNNAKDGREHSECGYFSVNEIPSGVDDQLFNIIKKVLS